MAEHESTDEMNLSVRLMICTCMALIKNSCEFLFISVGMYSDLHCDICVLNCYDLIYAMHVTWSSHVNYLSLTMLMMDIYSN